MNFAWSWPLWLLILPPIDGCAQHALPLPAPSLVPTAVSGNYAQMLAVAQIDPAGTDWTALRAAYAASPAYDPTTGDGPAMRDCIAATNTENWPEAAAEAQIAINQNFMDLRAHIFAVRTETELGNAAAANREAPIAIGMLHTI